MLIVDEVHHIIRADGVISAALDADIVPMTPKLAGVTGERKRRTETFTEHWVPRP